MQHAKERALLDFSYAKKVKPESPIVMNALSAKKIKKLKKFCIKCAKLAQKKVLFRMLGHSPFMMKVIINLRKHLMMHVKPQN